MSNENPPADHVVVDDAHEDQGVEQNVKSKSTWTRFVFMLVFYLLACVASFVLTIVIVLGFLWVLFTGDRNDRLSEAGQGLATYLYGVIRYLTYNSDTRPFPFDEAWPSSAGDDADDDAED